MSNKIVRSILGTMEMGRRASQSESEKMLSVFKNMGLNELDSAFMYAGGKTEEVIGNFPDKEYVIASKANPWDDQSLRPESVRNQLEVSLKRLKCDHVDIFYLHCPDHNTPLVDTLREVNKLYTEKKFLEFGLSNYSSWLVAEVYNLCKQNGWVKPTVYQGMYSAITRKVEAELFPCLRYFNIRFYAYSPLGGGFLTGKHKFDDLNKTEPGRFFGEGKWVAAYRNRYWKKEYFDGIEKIRNALNEIYGEGQVSVPESAYRWLYHHSCLSAEKGDGVIVGAANADQLQTNLHYINKGPLDEKIITIFNDLWVSTSHISAEYAR